MSPTPAPRGSPIGTEPGRAAFVRRGILGCGLPTGTVVTAWMVAKAAGNLERLHAPAGWARLILLIVLGIAEWGIGLGWIVGEMLWFLHRHPLGRSDR